MGVPLDLEVAGKSAFWSGLDWMPSGKTLWNFIKDLHPTLLTAPPMNLEPSWEATKVGKKIWAENNLGAGVPMIVDIDKEKYVKGPQSILIDDSKHNKGPWEKNKGSFIWHGGGEKNFHVVDNGRGSVLESIRQLRDLVSKLPEHGKEAP